MKGSLSRRLFQGGSLYFAAMLFQKLSAAVFLVVLARQIPVAHFGMLMLGVTSTNLLSLLALFGLPTAASRFLAGRDPADLPVAITSILTLGALYALALMFLLLPFSGLLAGLFSEAETFRTVFLIAVVGIPVQAGFRLYESILQSRECNRQLFHLSIADGIYKLAWPVLIYRMVGSVEGAMAGVVIAYLLSAVTARQLAVRSIGAARGRPRLKLLTEMAGFALPTTVVGFSYVLATQADRLMVGLFRESGEVAAYAAASVFAMMLSMLHTAFARIFLPLASDSYFNGDPAGLNHIYALAARWASIASGIGVLFLAAFGRQLLGIFGEEYQTGSAHITMMILALFHFCASVFGPTTSVLQMGGSHRNEGINALFFLGANVGLNVLLIPRMGMTGAAVATLVSGLFRNIIQAIQLRGRHGMTVITPAQILVVTIVVVGLTLQVSLSDRFGYVPAALSVAVLGIHFLTRLTHEEKSFAQSIGLRLQSALLNR